MGDTLVAKDVGLFHRGHHGAARVEGLADRPDEPAEAMTFGVVFVRGTFFVLCQLVLPVHHLRKRLANSPPLTLLPEERLAHVDLVLIVRDDVATLPWVVGVVISAQD